MNMNKMIKQIKKFNKAQQKLQENIKDMQNLSREVAQETISYWQQQNEILKELNENFKGLN